MLVGLTYGKWCVWGEYKSLSTCYLQEVDEVTEHQPVEFGQRLNHSDGRHRVVTVTDTLLVEVHWDEWFLQLPIPQLHQRGCKRQTILLVFIFSPNIRMWTQKQTLRTIYILPHLERWGQRDSLGSSTDPPGASTRSLRQCLRALWK